MVEKTLSLAFLGENLIDRSQFVLRVVKCCFVERDKCRVLIVFNALLAGLFVESESLEP